MSGAAALSPQAMAQPAPTVEQSLGEPSGQTDRLFQQAEEYYRLSQFEAALTAWQEALGLYRQEGNPAGEAATLNGIGDVLCSTGDCASALTLHEQSLEISQEIGDRSTEAAAIDKIGVVYYDQRQYDDSLSQFERSLKINREIGDRSGEAENLDHIGTIRATSEDYAEALDYYNQSLAIHRETGDRIGEIDNLDHIGTVTWFLGDYPEALGYYQRSLTLSREIGYRWGEARALGNIGYSYFSLEDTDQALQYHQQSLALKQEINDRVGAAQTLRNIGALYASLEDYEQALDAYQQRLAIARELGDPAKEAIAIDAVAATYRSLKRYEEAIALYNQELAIVQDQEDPVEEGSTLNVLGNLYYAIEDYRAAIDYYQQSLSIFREAGDSNWEATLLRNSAIGYTASKEYDKAIGNYQQSLAIWNDLDDQENERETLSYVGNLLSSLDEQYDNRQYAALIPLYERSLALYDGVELERPGYSSSAQLADSLENLINLYWNEGDFDKVVSVLGSFSAAEEQQATTGLLSMATSFGSVLTEPLLNLAALNNAYRTDILLTANLKEVPNNATVTQLSMDSILRRKGRVLDLYALFSRQLWQRDDPAGRALLDELNTVRAQLAGLFLSGLGDHTFSEHQAEIGRLEDEAKRLSRELESGSGERITEASLAASGQVSTETIRALIPADAALVEFVSYRPYSIQNMKEEHGAAHYAAYILTQQGNIKAVDLGEAAPIDQQVAAFQRALSTRSANARRIARVLDEQIMAPIRPFVQGKSHLLISPDSQLNVIPFAALVDDQARYLLESYQISYLTSGRDLLKQQLDRPAGQPPVILANPDYNNAAGTTQVASSSLSSLGDQRSIDADTLKFSSLPGTAQEAAVIMPMLPGARIFTQQAATENILKELESPSILHIATHGFFLPDLSFVPSAESDSRGSLRASLEVIATDPAQAVPGYLENPLLRSGLAFAGVNARSSGSEDGIFTALEASGLNLHGTQLVVLSACETGLGAASDGEGVYGLRRAFAIAGAESQLMSLWQVDDAGTSELMQLYYQNLMEKKQGRSEALRNAQLALMNTGTYAHPYYWSSFIFSGDWRPLAEKDG